MKPGFQDQYTGTHAQNVNTVQNGLWNVIRNSMGKIGFVNDALAMWFCANDERTPGYVKAALFAALAYFVLPIDLVSDAIPVAGFADDAAVISSALYMFGTYVTEEHRRKASDVFGGALPSVLAAASSSSQSRQQSPPSAGGRPA